MENREKSLVVIKNLFTEISHLLGSEISTGGKKATVEAFITQSLRSIDKYFSEVSCGLYQWIGKPLPEVPENIDLKRKREKLERKEKRMSGKKYKEKFVSIWYKEWDDGKKYPLREFWSDAYGQKMDEIWRRIQDAKQEEENDKNLRISEAARKEVNDLLNDILYPIEATMVDNADVNTRILQHVIQIATAEHLLFFTKRACRILTLEVKKNGRWTTRSLALGKFFLSLREKIDGLSGYMDVRNLAVFYDIISGAELFLIEINNSIIEREKQERSQREFIEAVGMGFQKVVNQIVSVENVLRIMNRNMVGTNGKLSDLIVLNEKILRGIKENGSLISSLGTKIDGISDTLSSIEGAVFCIAFPDDKQKGGET